MSSTIHDVHVENIVTRRVGERVAAIRAEMKMTQADLAAEMSARLGREVRPLTVTRLEGGKRPIAVDELVAAADALRVKAGDLLSNEGLPMGVVFLNSASQEMFRATNSLKRALREWFWAKKNLQGALERQQKAPAITRIWAEEVSRFTLDELAEEAQSEAQAHGPDA